MSIVFIIQCIVVPSRNYSAAPYALQCDSEKGMAALCRLWELEAKVDPSLLAASIRNSESIFGHRQAKLVEGEAMQAVLLGKHRYCAYSFGKPFCASFLLELLGKSSLKTPWVLVVSPLTALNARPSKEAFSRCCCCARCASHGGGWTYCWRQWWLDPSTSKSRGFTQVT